LFLVGSPSEPLSTLLLSGGRINAHVGNIRFRELVVCRKKDYLSPATKKLEKAHIAAKLVQDIRQKNPSGRFLKEDPDGSWYDIGDAKAIKKVGQALREDAPDIRHDVQSDDEDFKDKSASSELRASGKVKSASSSQGSGDTPLTYEPLAYQPIGNSSAAVAPLTVGPPQHFGFQNRFSTTRNSTVSGAAAAFMQEDDQPHHPPTDVAFGRAFHEAPDAHESSVISGLSNTILSGMSGVSGLTDPISSLSGAADKKRGQHVQQLNARRAQQLEHLRQTWANTNSNRTMQNADMAQRAVMPAVAPQQGVQRSLSWQEVGSVAEMSWADHSLAGGGIHDAASIISAARSFQSRVPTDSDSLAFVEHMLGAASVSSRRSRASNHYAQNLYRPTMPPPAAAMPSSGASVASMSIASGGESIGSVRSIMSDLSGNLLALDLAEPRMMDQF
jgi:hypothetical protein